MTGQTCNYRHQIKTYTRLWRLIFGKVSDSILNFIIKTHLTALSLRSHKRNRPTCNTKSTEEVQFWTQLLGPTNWGEEWEKRRKTQSRDTQGSNYGQWPTMILVNDFRDFPASIQTMILDTPRATSSSPPQFCSPLQSCCLSGRLQVCNWCRLFMINAVKGEITYLNNIQTNQPVHMGNASCSKQNTIYQVCKCVQHQARNSRQHNAVAYPGILFRGGGVQQIQLRPEDRENGDLGAVAL
jgi:hypothetical protein